jgi:hypothetical protein
LLLDLRLSPRLSSPTFESSSLAVHEKASGAGL